jgi:ADP-dependent NAD(P)H-hydrate dehydratase / NAD(P)H-hydrate epimerase
LHHTQASRGLESLALAVNPPHGLMQAAGLAVARLALALTPHLSRVDVWCGPGNNGGDGLVAARHLHLAGKTVRVLLCGASPRRAGIAADATDATDAVWALHEAQAAGVSLHREPLDESADLLIDGLLGLGASRAPAGEMAALINSTHRRATPVLAIDIPSGLHPDTGALLGESAVRAQHTLSLLSLKPGCFTGQGRAHAGTVWLDRLGVPAGPAGPATAWLGCAELPVTRGHSAHKGSFGDLAVLGGGTGMVGAALLAARAGLAAGAGRVFCGLLDETGPGWDSAQPELMFRPADALCSPANLAASTVVCGCGGGSTVHAVLPAVLSHSARLVLDADALNAIASDLALAKLVATRAAAGRATVITPHPLEAARLLGCTTAAVQNDRLSAAHQLAQRFAATVVLKGSGTVITSRGQLPCINPSGNAALASAGTGDVLAGWIGGAWAAHASAEPSKLAAAAVWLHGHAADQFVAAYHGNGPLCASQLIDAMRAI